ncbi:FRG domain-containing protein [uncultured Bacteroides sp.]|uniref:FRG domain-containing protein n=1 Tax=uncultured Bacteroides sp. TaxID=162156 RepID=UPI002AAC2676|nr:FRG domain-containing protein [uncultured Bacteroides sp.]
MVNYKKEKISNINEFVSLVEKIKLDSEERENKAELLFRGQHLDKPLLPKLARLNLNGNISEIEKLMIEEFKRGIIPLSEFKPEDDWDLLALAQHHGLPTRLLDWTYNSLIALWFAVCEAASTENGVVWVLNAKVEDFRTDTEKNSPLSNKLTKIYRPKVVSRRISAQSGAFTVHKINANGKMIKFEINGSFSEKLTKIIIPCTAFKDLRRSLNLLGVNNSTVYPDLDGFCKHLERRFSKLEDEL